MAVFPDLSNYLSGYTVFIINSKGINYIYILYI